MISDFFLEFIKLISVRHSKEVLIHLIDTSFHRKLIMKLSCKIHVKQRLSLILLRNAIQHGNKAHLMVEFMSECTYFLASKRAYRVMHCRGRVSNFNQSEAIEHSSLASDWFKFETLSRKYRTRLHQ